MNKHLLLLQVRGLVSSLPAEGYKHLNAGDMMLVVTSPNAPLGLIGAKVGIYMSIARRLSHSNVTPFPPEARYRTRLGCDILPRGNVGNIFIIYGPCLLYICGFDKILLSQTCFVSNVEENYLSQCLVCSCPLSTRRCCDVESTSIHSKTLCAQWVVTIKKELQ